MWNCEKINLRSCIVLYLLLCCWVNMFDFVSFNYLFLCDFNGFVPNSNTTKYSFEKQNWVAKLEEKEVHPKNNKIIRTTLRDPLFVWEISRDNYIDFISQQSIEVHHKNRDRKLWATLTETLGSNLSRKRKLVVRHINQDLSWSLLLFFDIFRTLT